MAENGPEVEAVDAPKQGQKGESKVIEFTSVAQRLVLRQTQWTVDRRPHGRRQCYRIATVGNGRTVAIWSFHFKLRPDLKSRK